MSINSSYVLPIIAFVILWPEPAVSGINNSHAKIAIHLKQHQGKNLSCALSGGVPPCNESQANLNVHGNLGVEYDIYIMLLDGDHIPGISGAEFAIKYNSAAGEGLDLTNWISCGNLDHPGGGWPYSSGSSIKVVFTSTTNCQRTSASGDLDGGVTTVLAVLQGSASTNDVLEIAPIISGADTAVFVSACTPLTFVNLVDYPLATGKASFGSGNGYDPCKGPFSPFASFQGLTVAQKAQFQIKLNDIRPWAETQTLIFQGIGVPSDPMLFFPFRRAGIPLTDRLPPLRVTLSASELGNVVDSLSTISNLTDGNVDSRPSLLVDFLQTYDNPDIGFQAAVDSVTASLALQKTRKALLANTGAKNAIEQFMCRAALLPAQSPMNVTSSARIQIGSFRRSEGNETSVYEAQIGVKNTSGSTLAAPLSLALKRIPTVAILEPPIAGSVCRVSGYDYFDLGIVGGLAPGQEQMFKMRIRNEFGKKLKFTPILLAGPGVR